MTCAASGDAEMALFQAIDLDAVLDEFESKQDDDDEVGSGNVVVETSNGEVVTTALQQEPSKRQIDQR